MPFDSLLFEIQEINDSSKFKIERRSQKNKSYALIVYAKVIHLINVNLAIVKCNEKYNVSR